ncbi:MAG: phage terminase large subunit family protein, partial [Dorea sp.]
MDKYPGSSKKESDPISLAMERTKTFRNRKIYMTSTPTLATGHIWKGDPPPAPPAPPAPAKKT